MRVCPVCEATHYPDESRASEHQRIVIAFCPGCGRLLGLDRLGRRSHD
jgi:Zn-finger nucleic acid-binding protein